MKKQRFTPERDGFYGVYYPHRSGSGKAVIAMLGDSSDNRMVIAGVKWLHKRGCSVMAMSPGKKNYGHHNYPLERIERALQVLKSYGHEKIGIAGASATGMAALAAASLFPDITLTMALTPPDFIMEGFYKDGKDGAHERETMNPLCPGGAVHFPISLMPTGIHSIGKKSSRNRKKLETGSLAAACLTSLSACTRSRKTKRSRRRTLKEK